MTQGNIQFVAVITALGAAVVSYLGVAGWFPQAARYAFRSLRFWVYLASMSAASVAVLLGVFVEGLGVTIGQETPAHRVFFIAILSAYASLSILSAHVPLRLEKIRSDVLNKLHLHMDEAIQQNAAVVLGSLTHNITYLRALCDKLVKDIDCFGPSNDAPEPLAEKLAALRATSDLKMFRRRISVLFVLVYGREHALTIIKYYS